MILTCSGQGTTYKICTISSHTSLGGVLRRAGLDCTATEAWNLVCYDQKFFRSFVTNGWDRFSLLPTGTSVYKTTSRFLTSTFIRLSSFRCFYSGSLSQKPGSNLGWDNYFDSYYRRMSMLYLEQVTNASSPVPKFTVRDSPLVPFDANPFSWHTFMK